MEKLLLLLVPLIGIFVIAKKRSSAGGAKKPTRQFEKDMYPYVFGYPLLRIFGVVFSLVFILGAVYLTIETHEYPPKNEEFKTASESAKPQDSLGVTLQHQLGYSEDYIIPGHESLWHMSASSEDAYGRSEEDSVLLDEFITLFDQPITLEIGYLYLENRAEKLSPNFLNDLLQYIDRFRLIQDPSEIISTFERYLDLFDYYYSNDILEYPERIRFRHAIIMQALASAYEVMRTHGVSSNERDNTLRRIYSTYAYFMNPVYVDKGTKMYPSGTIQKGLEEIRILKEDVAVEISKLNKDPDGNMHEFKITMLHSLLKSINLFYLTLEYNYCRTMLYDQVMIDVQFNEVVRREIEEIERLIHHILGV